MGALTPQFIMDLETRMQILSEQEYVRFASNVWWTRLMRVLTTTGSKELITWLLSTASIEDLGPIAGKMSYDELLSVIATYESRFAGKGLRILKSQLEDTDGGGLDIAAKWSGDIGAYMAYWPQKRCSHLLMHGHDANAIGYDGEIFFSKSHPVCPGNTKRGVFANVFTGGAGETAGNGDVNYPGACPIDDSVPIDTAITNLSKMVGYIRGIRMPNGVDPRYLRPVMLMGPPRQQQRLTALAKAKFIAAPASSGAGTTDVDAVLQSFGFGEPIIADELGGFESDKTCFLVCEQLSSSQLGGLLLLEREPFSVTYYTGAQLPDLRRINQLEWLVQGRYGDGYGHPFVIFKIKGS